MKLEQTLGNERTIITYLLALFLIKKATGIIARRGGDPKAVTFIEAGIGKLDRQLTELSVILGQQLAVEQATEKILRLQAQHQSVAMTAFGDEIKIDFAESMRNDKIFRTFSLAMTMLGKSAQLLAERGADDHGMSFITTGIQLLANQLREFADHQEVTESLQQVCDQCGISLPVAEVDDEEVERFLWSLIGAVNQANRVQSKGGVCRDANAPEDNPPKSS